MKKVGGRFTLLALLVVTSAVLFLPSYPAVFQSLPPWLKKLFPNKGISLGLDLQGGIHLVLEVEEDRAVEIAVDRSVNAIQDLLVDKKIPVESVKRTAAAQVTLGFQKESVKRTAAAQVTLGFQKDDLKDQIKKAMDDFPAFGENVGAGAANTLVYELSESEIKRIKDSAINQALETIRNRIDQFGVAEPLIQRQGLRQIVVQLPGIKEPERARHQGAQAGQGLD